MKSFAAKPSDITTKWIHIDAEGLVLGRLASEVAKILRGKHKPYYTPYQDCGDYVVITNASKVHLTGSKMEDKVYYRHTGYAGGIKDTTPQKIFDKGYSPRVIEKAVLRMLPKESPLANQQFKKLRVFEGAEHPHGAQQPVTLDLGARNRKNKKG